MGPVLDRSENLWKIKESASRQAYKSEKKLAEKEGEGVEMALLEKQESAEGAELPLARLEQIEALIINELNRGALDKDSLRRKVVGEHTFMVSKRGKVYENRMVTEDTYLLALQTLYENDEILDKGDRVRHNPDWRPPVGGTC